MKKNLSIRLLVLLFVLVLPSLLFIGLAYYLFKSEYKSQYEDQKTIMELTTSAVSDEMKVEMEKSFSLVSTIASNPMIVRMVSQMGTVPNGLDNDDFQNLEGFDDVVKLLNAARKTGTGEKLFIAGLDSPGLITDRESPISEGFDVRTRDYFEGALSHPGTSFN